MEFINEICRQLHALRSKGTKKSAVVKCILFHYTNVVNFFHEQLNDLTFDFKGKLVKVKEYFSNG